MSIPENYKEIFELIRAKLDISESATIISGADINETWGPVDIDLVVQDGPTKYLIEVKSRVRVDNIARLVLLRELIKQEKDASRIIPVIAGKIIPHNIEEMARQLDITIVNIPRTMALSVHEFNRTSGNTRVTSEKSWRVITCLLKERTTSIRQLSLMEDVSYGWAHATIKALINQGIVTRKGNYVTISDIDKLLNGVAWERPLENVLKRVVYIGYNDAFTAARDLSQILNDKGIRFAFTSYTAGALYTGYAFRHDSVYLYVEKDEIDFFIETFEDKEKEGIKAHIFVSDREIFLDLKEKEGICIVSEAQALLDLAGLGYSGRDITNAMVDNYASI